jgi:Holliday junction resolvase-like predicted endonuclease
MEERRDSVDPSLSTTFAACADSVPAQKPANDTVPCRLDVVQRASGVRRLSVDGVERLGRRREPDLGAAAPGRGP